MLQDFIDKLPEDSREAFKAEIAHAIVIANREDAAKQIAENQFLKSERDAIISRTTDNYAQKFQAEKLPGLIEEEYKKRNPPKDPKDQALAEMEKRLKDMERAAVLKDRRNTAMQKLTEAGLPVDLAEFAIDEDENVFASKIEKLAGLKAWRDSEIERITKEKFGNQKPPVGGQPKEVPKMSLEKFNELPLAERTAFAKAGGVFE